MSVTSVPINVSTASEADCVGIGLAIAGSILAPVTMAPFIVGIGAAGIAQAAISEALVDKASFMYRHRIINKIIGENGGHICSLGDLYLISLENDYIFERNMPGPWFTNIQMFHESLKIPTGQIWEVVIVPRENAAGKTIGKDW